MDKHINDMSDEEFITFLTQNGYFKSEVPYIEARKLEESGQGEPSEDRIRRYMSEHPNESYYTAREILREVAYGGRPPHGYRSWGDYHKAN